MSTLDDWVGAVCRELGIADLVVREVMQPRVLNLSRDVAHGVARPAAPLTAYLLGLAAGRSPDPEAASEEFAERVRVLAQRWTVDQES